MGGLLPQSPRHFARQPSARVSQTLRSSYPNHMTAVATAADQHWYFHGSDFRNKLISAHTTPRTRPTFGIRLG
jgi:hypothetical protein